MLTAQLEPHGDAPVVCVCTLVLGVDELGTSTAPGPAAPEHLEFDVNNAREALRVPTLIR